MKAGLISFRTQIHFTKSLQPLWGIELQRGASVTGMLTTVLPYCTKLCVGTLALNMDPVKWRRNNDKEA